MEIDLTKLKSGVEDSISIDEVLSFAEETLKGTGILALEKVHVKGSLTRGMIEGYDLSLHIDGKMILPCSLTLEPTEYPFQIELEDDLLTLFEEIDEKVKKIENTIDILPIIWENILMEIPMRVVSDKATSMKKEGDGWKLVTEDEEKDIVNPAFAKLHDLF